MMLLSLPVSLGNVNSALLPLSHTNSVNLWEAINCCSHRTLQILQHALFDLISPLADSSSRLHGVALTTSATRLAFTGSYCDTFSSTASLAPCSKCLETSFDISFTYSLRLSVSVTTTTSLGLISDNCVSPNALIPLPHCPGIFKWSTQSL